MLVNRYEKKDIALRTRKGRGTTCILISLLALTAISPALSQSLAPGQGLAPNTGSIVALGASSPARSTMVYRLGYSESSRTLDLLAILGYQVRQAGQVGNPIDDANLPAIVGLQNASRVSLLSGGSAAGSTGGWTHPLSGTLMDSPTETDPLNRLLIVYDPQNEAGLGRLLSLLRDDIDQPARQILMEALVVEIDSDWDRDLGFSYQYQSDHDQGRKKLGTTLFGAQASSGIEGLPFVLSFSSGTGVMRSFMAALSAQMASGNAEILSKPSVLVLEDRQARIMLSQSIPYIQDINQTLAGTTSSIGWIPIGIVLNFNPRLNADGSQVSMQIETIISEVIDSVPLTTSGAEQVFVAPTFDSTHVQSFVRIADGSPFVIGGLISRTERKSKSGVPGLAKIPGLGSLFRRTRVNRRKRELIIIITPHVISETGMGRPRLTSKGTELMESLDSEFHARPHADQEGGDPGPAETP